MAVTLTELAKASQNPLEKAVIQDLLRKSDLLNLAPIENVSTFRPTSVRWQTLPSVSTRAFNGSYSESTGALEQVQETLHIYGGEINVDRVAAFDKSLVEPPMKTQTQMKVAAMAYKFNDDFINGDHATDPLGFEGLKKRVSNLPARMTIAAGASDTLKILADTPSEHAFIDKLHELIHVTGANALLMNEKTYLGIGRVLRRAQLLNTGVDNYGRKWEEFAGCKLVDVGLKGDQSTEIITSTETALDTHADSTSIYGVRFDGEDGFRIIQAAGSSPTPYDPLKGAESPTAPVNMMRIDWVIGLQNVGRYAVGRLYNFTVAAS